MHCHGYTDDLELLCMGLPIKELAADRIDPWRLDLCDPSPVRKIIDGKTCNFRRIQSLALIYRTESGGAVVCMHDGVEDTCVQGEFGLRDGMEVVSNLRPCEDSYEQHLAEYLRLFEDKQFADLNEYYQDVCRTKMISEDTFLPPNKGVAGVYLPRDTRFLKVDTDLFLGRSLDGCTRGDLIFAGTMFERVDIQTTLPRSISWVFEALEEYSPIIFGPCLRDQFLGKPVTQVHVLISKFANEELLRELLLRDGAKVVRPHVAQQGCVELVVDGVRYYIWGLFHTQRLEMFNYTDALKLCHTADCLFAENARGFKGLRIAFDDIGHWRARSLAEGNAAIAVPRASLIGNLQREGFTLVPTAFSLAAKL